MKLWLFQTGNFVLTVTRIDSEKDTKKKLTAKRKTSKISANLSIYMFNTFDEYLEFCTSLQCNIENNAYKSSLYLKWYLKYIQIHSIWEWSWKIPDYWFI